MGEGGNKPSLDVDSIDTSMLLGIDVSRASALPVDVIESINWDLVATDNLGIMDPIGQLRAWLESLLSGFVDTIRRAFEAVVSPIKAIIDRIWSTLSAIPPVLSDIANTLRSVVVKPIQDALNWVSTNFPAVVDAVRTAITAVHRFLAELPARVSKFIDSVRRLFEGFANAIESGFARLAEQVAKLPDVVRGFIDAVSRLFGDLADRIRSGFAWFLDQIPRLPDVVRWLVDSVSRLFSELVDRVRSGFAWLVEQLGRVPDVVRGLVDSVARALSDLAERARAGFAWLIEQVARIPDVVRDWVSRVHDILRDLVDRVRPVFTWLAEYVGKLPDVVRGLADAVAQAFGELVERVRSGFAWFIEQVAKLPDVVSRVVTSITGRVAEGIGGVVEWIRSGFEALRKTLDDWFARAREWFHEATRALQAVRTALEVGFQGFVNVLMGLPRELQKVFSAVAEFFGGLWSAVQDFTKNPVEWLKKNILEPLWSGLVWLGGKLLEALKTLWRYIEPGVLWLWERLVDLFGLVKAGVMKLWEAVSNILTGFSIAIANAFKHVGRKIKGWFISVLEWINEGVSEATKYISEKVLTPFWSLLPHSGPPGLTLENFVKAWGTSFMWSIPLYIFALSVELPLRLAAFVARGIAMALRDHNLSARLSLKFLGFGGEVHFDIFKALGSALYNFSEELLKHADKFYEPFWMGLMFWYGRFASQVLTYHLRNFIPIEFPTIPDIKSAFRRVLVAKVIPPDLGKKPSDITETMLNFMRIRGYSDYLVRWTFAAPEEFYTVVKDRFGAERIVPLAEVWELPSRSDVVTMMIRDVIPDPEEFKRVMLAIGYTEDIAKLYYLLHFRYPSPEKLAEFYWRGVAGVLWLDQTFEEPAVRSFMGIGWSAEAPKRLNFNMQILNDMLSKYMKWHDYFPAAWSKGFPTDKSIVVELMADLPDKVDFRWMARWGIMEHLSKLGVGMVTAIDEVVEKMKSARGVETVSERVTPEISLDVSLLARFLEARGVHPYFAAIAAVAGMHTALTDEMTLLRTGFLELYRTGLVDLNTAEKLMSGLFTIKFTTGYIDPSTARAVTFNYMKPVFWLPAERRLLQLRAAMDRVYEIWRAVLREVASGVMRLGISVSEAISMVKKYSSIAADALNKYVKAITGVDWRPSIDEDYVNLWIEYGSLLRAVEARTWVRHYITRIVAWIIYRSSYGWVKEEDFRQLVEKVVEAGWLTKDEGEFFTLIFPLIVGMVRRETIPTALTLATMAEYMVIDDSVINRVFEDQRVVEEYRELYRKYIAVKPFKSDYKALLNRARRALLVGAISEEEWSNLTKQAVARYGFREEEIRIQEMLAEIEERMMGVKEYLPTPTTIATLSEYLDIPKHLVESALKKRRVPEEWASLWLRYIEVKPVKPDYRAVLSTALRALRYGAITADEWKKLLDAATRYGFTAEEVRLLQLRAELELAIEEAREYVPTPSMLAAMAEHLPEARDYIKSVLEARRVRGVWAELWTKYIYLRPVVDEVRRWASAVFELAERAIISVEQLKPVYSILMTYGWEKLEIEIAEKTILANAARRAWAELLGSARQLAAMARYSPAAADMAWTRVSRLVDLLPVDDSTKRLIKEMWKTYIVHYQNYPEIRSYISELVSAYAYGVIDDRALDRELSMLKDMGVPETTLSLVKRRAQLRRARLAARAALR